MPSILKKQKLICTLVLLALIISSSVLIFTDYVGDPIFSEKSGFYEDDFYLELSAFNADKIYYTLDGSVPDENSYEYTEPILISNATYNENTNSMRTDTVVNYYTDLIDQYDPGYWFVTPYAPPDFLIDKCTVIRAIAVNHNGVVSEITSSTFFVEISPDDYDNCNILSIITDPDNLFDEDKGIYVTGQVFENQISQGLEGYFMLWPANYNQRGKEWEREAVFQFFDSSGNLVLSKCGGIRTQGNVSRGALPKSLNMYARTEYDGRDHFDTYLFGNDYNPKAVTLYAAESFIQFRDNFMTEMVKNLNFATKRFEPYIMFLDGEYWGFYWLTEKYDEEYLSYYYNVEPSNTVIVKNYQLEAGNEEDMGLYTEMVNFISGNDMSNPANYSKACSLIDMNSYIDYFATMIYIARQDDWPSSNFALWRTRETTGTGYSDGKWRWMLFDCNSKCMGSDIIEHDTLSYVMENDKFFASLWKNPDFQSAFKERILYIAEQCFNSKKTDAFIDNFKNTMTPILHKNADRFLSKNSELDYTLISDTLNGYKEFFRARRTVVETWFD